MTTTTVPTTVADRLRAAAEYIEQHSDVLDPHSITCDDGRVTIHDYSVNTAADLARASRALGGHWDKVLGGTDDGLFTLRREVVDGVTVELTAWRAEVCERVVTGTREVEVEEPDPDAVAALPKIKRVETVEDFEWRCGPLLADQASAAA